MGRAFVLAVWVCAGALIASTGGAKEAKRLARLAAAAEKAGQMVQAYALYSEAFRLDPSHNDYLMHAQSLRPFAELASPRQQPKEAQNAEHIAPQELTAVRELQPVPSLNGAPGNQSFDVRGDARALFEKVAEAYHLLVVFDPEYQPGRSIRFQINDADFRTALRALEAATNSFVVPAADRLIFVVNDTADKRTRYEPTMSVVVPAPDTVTPQELQELVAAVRGTLEIQHIAVDNQQHVVVMRDRVSRVRPAQALLEQLMHARAQVDVEVELLSTDKSLSLAWGFPLPNSFPLVDFGQISRLVAAPSIPSGFSNFVSFGRGATLIGVGVTNSSLFASATKSIASSEYDTHVEASDGLPATVHIGQKYPIVTSQFSAFTSGATGSQSLTGIPAPTIQFEDLGLNLKITPHVHGTEEMSLDLEAQIELLGSASVNGIPELNNTKFQSTVRLRTGQWAIITGMVSGSEAKTISGIAGVASIPVLGPLFSNNNTTRDRSEALIVIKPRLRSLPPSESLTRAVSTGTEARPETVL